MPDSAVLNLNDLTDGMPGLSSRMGGVMAEAASVCLDDYRHGSPVRLSVDGDETPVYDLKWFSVDGQVRRTWADDQVTTEYGACGIAILVEPFAETLER